MSLSTQPIALNFATKKEVTVTTSAGTSQSIGALSGPIQARVANYDTARVAVLFGTQTAANAITVAGSPTIPPSGVEVLTIVPNSDGTAVYWNVIGDTGAVGNKFEVTLGSGI